MRKPQCNDILLQVISAAGQMLPAGQMSSIITMSSSTLKRKREQMEDLDFCEEPVCPICRDVFAGSGDGTPYSFACGHSVCRLCLGFLKGTGAPKRCPLCRAVMKDWPEYANGFSKILVKRAKGLPSKPKPAATETVQEEIKLLRVRIAAAEKEHDILHTESLDMEEDIKGGARIVETVFADVSMGAAAREELAERVIDTVNDWISESQLALDDVKKEMDRVNQNWERWETELKAKKTKIIDELQAQVASAARQLDHVKKL